MVKGEQTAVDQIGIQKPLLQILCVSLVTLNGVGEAPLMQSPLRLEVLLQGSQVPPGVMDKKNA